MVPLYSSVLIVVSGIFVADWYQLIPLLLNVSEFPPTMSDGLTFLPTVYVVVIDVYPVVIAE